MKVCKRSRGWGTNLPTRKNCESRNEHAPVVGKRELEAGPKPSASHMFVSFSGHGTGVGLILKAPATVGISVFDLHGRLVENLTRKDYLAGRHEINWKTNRVPAGICFLRLSLDGVDKQVLRQIVL